MEVNNNTYKSVTTWNYILLVLVVTMVFFIDLFPKDWHSVLYNVMYTLLFAVAILALERDKKVISISAAIIILLEWISTALSIQEIETASMILNFLFFTVISGLLIGQVAQAKRVGPKVILEAINGYLLMGLVFSIIIAVIMKYDPGAISFNHIHTEGVKQVVHFGDYLYFGFVTLSTLGYGDIVPKEPYTRSLATLIAVCGQLYVAIIIALLVGKFSSQKD